MMRELRPGADHHLLGVPFAVSLLDGLSLGIVAEGLVVGLRDPGRPERFRPLAANRHGVFVAHALPRLRADAGDDSPPPALRPFVLEVDDPQGRFLPLRLTVALPRQGGFDPCGWNGAPSENPPRLPLYSAPTRQLGSGIGIVRAELRAVSPAMPEGQAAGWARLAIWLDGTVMAEGLADHRGIVLLPVPLPPPRDPPLHDSPPQPFDGGRWDVRLRAYWDPALAAGPVPDLAALRSAPEVSLATDSFVLQSGVPLIARDADSSFLSVGA